MATGEKILKRRDALVNEKSQWEGMWEDVAAYVFPRKNPVRTRRVAGRSVTDEVFDVTAIGAVERAAAGLYAYLCPPTKQWLTIQPADEELRQDPATAKAFRELTTQVYGALSTSNWPQQIHEFFLELLGYGTACLSDEEDSERPGEPRYRAHGIVEYVFAENHRGEVDTVFRTVKYTARQANEKWGKDTEAKLPTEVVADAENKPDAPHEFVHAVMPNEDYNAERADKSGMRYSSFWVYVASRELVREGGYHEMPYHIARFSKGTDELWGRGPGTMALPAIKEVNEKRRTLIKASQLAVAPPLFASTRQKELVARWSLEPFAVNPYSHDPSGADERPFSLDAGGRVDWGWEDVSGVQQEIRGMFFVDLFMALAQMPSDNKTATEVMELVEEKMTMLAPMLGRLQRELFDAAVERTVNMRIRAGKWQPPEAIAERDSGYEIEYGGKLALALKAMGVNAFQRATGILMPFTEVNPEITDLVDWDAAGRGVLNAQGVPSEWITDEQEVKKIREARGKAAQREEALETAERGASAMSNASQKPAPGSPAEGLMDEVKGATL